MAHSIPGATFVEVPDVGHMAPLESPQIVNAAIENFLRSLFGIGGRHNVEEDALREAEQAIEQVLEEGRPSELQPQPRACCVRPRHTGAAA